MAEPAKVSKSFSRVLHGVRETLCEKLDLKKVGELLTTGTRLNKTLRKNIKHAVKTEDVEFFFSVLSQMFTLKSLVFFLEVLDSTASQNRDHKQILSILCHDLGDLAREKESEEIVAQLEVIRAKYVSSSSLANPIVLYYEHEVEKYSFDKSSSNHFYSPNHDVTVFVDPNSFPEDLDKFNMYLKVNDYSQPVSMPAQYTGVYSALINLKCDPHFDRFRDYVTVTLPHYATADIHSLCQDLCVLTAADGNSKLEEDPEIIIDFIDEDYITFRTQHFSSSRVSGSQRRRQRYVELRIRARMRAALSLDEATASRGSPVSVRQRAYSSPTILRHKIASKFCVKLCRPRDISNQSTWQFVFIVTTNELTLTKEVKTHAVALLDLPDDTELVLTEARFTFTSDDYITFDPNLSNKNGWTISSEIKPAEILKDGIEQYWQLPRRQRKSIDPPYIRYTATREELTGHQLEYTSFCISLSGSQSLGKRETIVIEVQCHLKPHPPRLQPNSIKIIRDMYQTSTGYSPILRGVLGEMDSSKIPLGMGDKYCCILLCEISFHLYQWRALGEHLGMTKADVDVVRLNHEHCTYFHEPAFQLLATWLQQSTEPRALQDLLKGLQGIKTQLQVTTWTTTYNITRNFNGIATLFLAQNIQHHWRFIARLVGESETDIHAVVQDEMGRSVCNQASNMIEQLKKRIVDDDNSCIDELPQTALTSLQVFNSIHCIWEHIKFEPMHNALSRFT